MEAGAEAEMLLEAEAADEAEWQRIKANGSAPGSTVPNGRYGGRPSGLREGRSVLVAVVRAHLRCSGARDDEPGWMATARLLEHRFPDEFGPPAGPHISVQIGPGVVDIIDAPEGEEELEW